MVELRFLRSRTSLLCVALLALVAQGQEPKPAKEPGGPSEPSFYYGPPIKINEEVTITVEKQGRDTITFSGKGFEEFTIPGIVITDKTAIELIIPAVIQPSTPAPAAKGGKGSYGGETKEKNPSVEVKNYKLELNKYKLPDGPSTVTISRNNKEVVTVTGTFSSKEKSVGVVIPLGKGGR